jgi:hypothetical protein
VKSKSKTSKSGLSRHKIKFKNGSRIILKPIGVQEKPKGKITLGQAQEIIFGKP